ncbi:winged helix-turn-helix domain-containing protein [Vibrio paucivorans]
MPKFKINNEAIFISENQKLSFFRTGREVTFRSKESKLLTLLCDRYPSPVSREAIKEVIWQGRYVSNESINQTIKNLRSKLSIDQGIKTIPKLGYEMNVEVKRQNILPPLGNILSRFFN